MSVDLRCACGKWLRMTAEAEGGLGRCPACGTILELPNREPSEPPPTIKPNPVDPATALTNEPGAERTDRPDGTDAWSESGWREEVAGEGERGAALSPPVYRLASPGQIGLGGFLGGPLAGFLLMCRNYANCGRWAACWGILAVGILLTALAVGIGAALPDTHRSVNLCIGLPFWIVTYLTAKSLQGSLFQAHSDQGGQSASVKTMIGYTLLGVVLTFGGAFAVGVLYEIGFGDRLLQVTAKEEIYYSSEIPEADVRRVAFVLQQNGYFDGSGEKSVRLHKDSSSYSLSFYLIRGFDDPQLQQYFRGLGDEVSHVLQGREVRVELCDRWENVKRRLPAQH